jgi:UDP-GlcNAc:undecaprenyl-phosphate/decaprenyl-phosphate GlcNAc-1-phosphate transferase
MERYLIVVGLAIVLTAFLLVYLAPIARQIGLVDRPNNRKRHEDDIPLIGGLGIGIVFLLALLLMPFSLRDYRMFVFSIVIILIVGSLDDRKDIAAWAKFIAQVGICLLLVLMEGFSIPHIGDIFGRGISQGLGELAVPVTILALVSIINGVNVIDGLDGLAGAVCLISLLGLGYLCHVSGQSAYLGILLLVAGLVSVFLLFNLAIFGAERKVFLGDAGSMFLGFVIGYFLIILNGITVPSHISASHSLVVKTTAAPWLIGLPLFDLVSSIIRRLVGTKSIMSADRGHMHHRLLDLGYSKRYVLIAMTLFHLILVSVGVIGTLWGIPDWLLFWLPFGLVGFYSAYTIYQERRLFEKPWRLD